MGRFNFSTLIREQTLNPLEEETLNPIEEQTLNPIIKNHTKFLFFISFSTSITTVLLSCLPSDQVRHDLRRLSLPTFRERGENRG